MLWEAGTAFGGEQGAGRTGGTPGDLGDQVQLVRLSRGLGGQSYSRTLGEQVELLGMSRGLGGQGVPREIWGSGFSFWG